jgi:hypothetical protein
VTPKESSTRALDVTQVGLNFNSNFHGLQFLILYCLLHLALLPMIFSFSSYCALVLRGVILYFLQSVPCGGLLYGNI